MEQSAQPYAAVTLPPKKRATSTQRIGSCVDPSRRSGRKEEKIRWPFTGNEPQFLGRPDRSLVNTPTVLFRLMHGGEHRVGLIILKAVFQTITWEIRKSVTVYNSYVWRYLGQSITATFDGIWTVYNSYVWRYLGQSITATFDGIWGSLSQLRLMVYGQSITATFDGIWDSLWQLRFMVSGAVYYSYVWRYLDSL